MLQKKRLLAIIIDYYLILFLSSIPFIILIGNTLKITTFSFNIYISLVMTFLILKDLVFKNASIGKKIMKIEVLKSNNYKPDMLIIILRNSFLIFWPIEAILFFVKGKRLGDIFLNTKVVNSTK